MKKLASYEAAIGGDGATLGGALGIEESNLVAQVEVKYPVEKVLSPVLKVVDDLVDKLEKLIPGDQTAMAEKAKADARAALIEMLNAQA